MAGIAAWSHARKDLQVSNVTSIIYFMILIAYWSRVRIQMMADFNTTISITVLAKLSAVSAGWAKKHHLIDFIAFLDKLKHVRTSLHFRVKKRGQLTRLTSLYAAQQVLSFLLDRRVFFSYTEHQRQATVSVCINRFRFAHIKNKDNNKNESLPVP